MPTGVSGHPWAFLLPHPKGKEVFSPSMTVPSANSESLASSARRPTNKKFKANEPKSWQNQEVQMNGSEKDIPSLVVPGGDSPLSLARIPAAQEPTQPAEMGTGFSVFLSEA